MASQPIRKDPSGSRSLEKKFQQQIVMLVNRYRAECVALVQRNHGREMEAPVKPPMNPMDLTESIRQLAGITITQHADPIAENAAIMAFQHGTKWAEKALSTKGMIPPGEKERKLFFLNADRRAIEKIRARNFSEIKGMSDDLAKRMSRSLVDGFEQRETMAQLIKRVRDVTDFGNGRAEVIARTETMRAVNGAAVDRYQREGVDKVEFLAAWDDRVCDECESKHGEIYDIGSAPYLPIHPNCRCTLAPVIE